MNQHEDALASDRRAVRQRSHVLEGQRLATEVGGCVGIEDGAARVGGVTAQGDVSPAAQDVAL